MNAQDRKKQFYTRQRLNAETGAREGDTSAQKTTAKIYGKLGKRVPQSERLGAGKPGASEGEQMGNIAMAGGVLGDVGKLVGGLRAAVPMAEEAGARMLGRGAAAGAKRSIPGGARVVGKATVEDAPKALGRGRAALRDAGKSKPLARQLKAQGRSPRGSGLGESAPKRAPRGSSAKAADAEKTVKDTPRKVNPRAAGTHPRAMGTNPRAVAARRASTKEAQTGTGVPTRVTEGPRRITEEEGTKAKGRIGKRAADIIRKGEQLKKKKT